MDGSCAWAGCSSQESKEQVGSTTGTTLKNQEGTEQTVEIQQNQENQKHSEVDVSTQKKQIEFEADDNDEAHADTEGYLAIIREAMDHPKWNEYVSWAVSTPDGEKDPDLLEMYKSFDDITKEGDIEAETGLWLQFVSTNCIRINPDGPSTIYMKRLCDAIPDEIMSHPKLPVYEPVFQKENGRKIFQLKVFVDDDCGKFTSWLVANGHPLPDGTKKNEASVSVPKLRSAHWACVNSNSCFSCFFQIY